MLLIFKAIFSQVDAEMDKVRWEREVKLEVNERKIEFQATVWNPYREKVRKYKHQLKVC